MYMITQYKDIPDDFVVPLNFADFGEEALEKQIVIDGCLPHRCYAIEIEIEMTTGRLEALSLYLRYDLTRRSESTRPSCPRNEFCFILTNMEGNGIGSV